MKNLYGVIAAIAAGLGAGAAGAMPDPEEIAKLGPMLGAFVLYLEIRWRPLITDGVTEVKKHREELEKHPAAALVPAKA